MPYLYDVEVFKNFFCATFLSIDTDQKVIDQYIQADIKHDWILKQSIIKEFKYEMFIISDINNFLICINR